MPPIYEMASMSNLQGDHKILIVIPTYNERENLPELLARLPSELKLELLFIDDNSGDGTAEWIKELAGQRAGIHLIQRPSKLGLGTAYIAGFKWALERDYELIIEMDADLSHDPKDIRQFIQSVRDGADLVIGSRYINGIRIINWPLGRLMLSKFASAYTRFFTGLPLTDPTSGFKCFRRHVLKALQLDKIQSNGYGFQIEMDFYAWKKGFKLVEVPIIFTDRHHGTSKMNSQIVREAVWMVPSLGLRALFGLL